MYNGNETDVQALGDTAEGTGACSHSPVLIVIYLLHMLF